MSHKIVNKQLRGQTTHTAWGPLKFDASGVAEVEDKDGHKELLTLEGWNDFDPDNPPKPDGPVAHGAGGGTAATHPAQLPPSVRVAAETFKTWSDAEKIEFLSAISDHIPAAEAVATVQEAEAASASEALKIADSEAAAKAELKAKLDAENEAAANAAKTEAAKAKK